MPSNKQKPTAKKRAVSFWILIIVSPLVLLTGAIWMYDYSYDQQVNREEDVTFRKMEAFINNIKKDLDKEIPEAKWEINKSCTKPSTKGSFEAYSCEVGVGTESNIPFKEK